MSKTAKAETPGLTCNDTPKALADRFLHHLRFTQGEGWATATPHDHFFSLALSVRDLIVDRMVATQRAYHEQDVKRVYYLSLEYLLGKQLRNNMVCLGVYDTFRGALSKLGLDIEKLCELEPDAGLGNGGLGRLAACYIDSASTLQLPFYGYGIRYEYGIFEQEIVDGWQIEQPDYWLRFGSPWEIARPEHSTPVRLFGYVEDHRDARGGYRPVWKGYRTVIGLPYDMPIIGYGVNTVNLLRLWAAKASQTFDLAAFNRGSYVDAVQDKAISETISKVLYPSDHMEVGKELRLQQQYFFVACTLSDILRRYEKNHDTMDNLPNKVAVQLNDTHPSLAVSELMRILVDERGLPWDKAWELTTACIAYTNHTLLPEALEMWPVQLLGRVLPRHLQIIFEINRRFLGTVEQRWPGDVAKVRNLSLIQEGPVKCVRMANLAIVGSHHVNGVADLHTKLIRRRLVPDFAELSPEKFINITNGVTPRRWLLASNPELAAAVIKRIGDGWIRDLEQLRDLERFSDDPEFQDEIRAVKLANKKALADWIQRRLGVRLNPESLFDVQVKRLHEYKRQLLNILQVIMRYQRILLDPGGRELPPRVYLFGAKAAPAYSRAKHIIKLICDVANVVNKDKRVGDRLKVVFLPNYCVSLAERIVPAADLSEQISTAGMEASGTGNMKFAMNGALTIGTLDGANIEIRERVGEENFFLFGLTAEQIADRRGHHNPWDTYHNNMELRRALDALAAGEFNRDSPYMYKQVTEWVTNEGDYYMLMADIDSYIAAQNRVDALWRDPRAWTRAAILNIARVGYFSSDRSVKEYAEKIWNVVPIPIASPSPAIWKQPTKPARTRKAAPTTK